MTPALVSCCCCCCCFHRQIRPPPNPIPPQSLGGRYYLLQEHHCSTFGTASLPRADRTLLAYVVNRDALGTSRFDPIDCNLRRRISPPPNTRQNGTPSPHPVPSSTSRVLEPIVPLHNRSTRANQLTLTITGWRSKSPVSPPPPSLPARPFRPPSPAPSLALTCAAGPFPQVPQARLVAQRWLVRPAGQLARQHGHHDGRRLRHHRPGLEPERRARGPPQDARARPFLPQPIVRCPTAPPPFSSFGIAQAEHNPHPYLGQQKKLT